VASGQRAGALRELRRVGKVALWRHSVTARLPWVELTADEPVQVNLDGEPISAKAFRFEVLAGALDACLPDNAPVLGH
jgi:diacylglycerol kinase family enzyme